MANSDYLIAGNDEHGLEPMPTIGKRTPYINQVGRSFYRITKYRPYFRKRTKIQFEKNPCGSK